jgi:hypothetical protein
MRLNPVAGVCAAAVLTTLNRNGGNCSRKKLNIMIKKLNERAILKSVFFNPFWLQYLCLKMINLGKRSFINDVTVLRGKGQRFCDDSTKALVINSI